MTISMNGNLSADEIGNGPGACFLFFHGRKMACIRDGGQFAVGDEMFEPISCLTEFGWI